MPKDGAGGTDRTYVRGLDNYSLPVDRSTNSENKLPFGETAVLPLDDTHIKYNHKWSLASAESNFRPIVRFFVETGPKTYHEFLFNRYVMNMLRLRMWAS